MNDCDLRKPGQDFCDECPHRAVREDCLRVGFVPRSTIDAPPSFQTRVGVALLSALALLVVPVALRTMLRLRVEGDVSHVVASIIGFFLTIIMVVVTAAALYGLYVAIWAKRPTRA